MELNDIKKALYKEPNNRATFDRIKKGIAYYSTEILDKEGKIEKIIFSIPIEDMGEAEFNIVMKSKYLIRWIVNNKVP
jgi:hypothetical protein